MSWHELLSIAQEAEELKRDELSRPPAACPHCGEPLRQGPREELFCLFDGYRYPRDG